MHDTPSSDDRPPRIGSLFSGYGGLDLAVEHATGGQTIWFSEVDTPVARVFTHHWPEAPNLGDIAAVDWTAVPAVDVLIGGFPCQDVSTVGKGAGLAPGIRSGLWSYMVSAIELLQPRLVVIENVRGLLSATATRPQRQGATRARNHDDATSAHATPRDVEPRPRVLGDEPARPLRALGAVLGDLADLRYDAQWTGLPASLAGAPNHRFRVFITAHPQNLVSHSAGFGLLPRRGNAGSSTSPAGNDRPVSPGHRLRPARTECLTDQQERLGDTVQPDRDRVRRWGRYAEAIARWEHITGHAAPAPAVLNEDRGPRPSPKFVEWLMGLPAGWITDPMGELTANQQKTALGNGVLPLQALVALRSLALRMQSR